MELVMPSGTSEFYYSPVSEHIEYLIEKQVAFCVQISQVRQNVCMIVLLEIHFIVTSCYT